MTYLVSLAVFLYECYGSEEYKTHREMGVGPYYGYDYYGDYYDWDSDLDSNLCWPVGVCLQSYNRWATSDSDSEYSPYYHTVSEYTSQQFECQSDVPHHSYYPDDPICSNPDSKYSEDISVYPYRDLHHVTCNNDCTSYVVIREYSIAYDYDLYNECAE